MKILLLSDTHSYIDERIEHYATWADEVWHAGDIGDYQVIERLEKIKPLQVVYGNIDDAKMRATFPKDLFFERGGLKILMTHIGGYPPRYNASSIKKIERYRPDVFICGHSHILKVQFDAKHKCIAMNPGAAGVYGFHKVRTMLRFEIIDQKIQNLEVIELGKR